ncbi:hypothetical protein [Amycolatopsis sp. NPDC003731]
MLFMVVATLMSFLGTATADTGAVPRPAAVTTSAAGDAPIAKPYAFEASIAKLRPHLLLRADGTFALAPSAARAGVPTDLYAQVVAGMTGINGLIQRGVLVARPDLSMGLVGASGDVISVLAAGVNRVNIHWWGIEVRLDSTNANRVAAALAGGGSAAAVLALIFGPVAAGVVAAVALVGSAAIYYCNSAGTGVRIVKPVVGPAYCTAQ